MSPTSPPLPSRPAQPSWLGRRSESRRICPSIAPQACSACRFGTPTSSQTPAQGGVRLNFVLGPWTSPADEAIYSGLTWRGTYQAIVSGLRGHSLSLYGLIGAEAMFLRSGGSVPPASAGWRCARCLAGYVRGGSFVAIAEMFATEFRAFELFNEPDDWHGQFRPWIHPGWFAIMLQRVYAAVRERPHLDGIKVISGPLEGIEVSNNGAVAFLRGTYRAGKRFYGWGQSGRPFPFDGVGYHLYAQQGYTADPVADERAVRTVFTRYLDQMHALIRAEEGRHLDVSEAGWNSDPDPKLVQAGPFRRTRSCVSGSMSSPGICWWSWASGSAPRTSITEISLDSMAYIVWVMSSQPDVSRPTARSRPCVSDQSSPSSNRRIPTR